MTSQLHLISFFHTNLFLRGVQHDWDRNQQRFDKNLINPAYLRYVHNETFGCYWKHSSWGLGSFSSSCWFPLRLAIAWKIMDHTKSLEWRVWRSVSPSVPNNFDEKSSWQFALYKAGPTCRMCEAMGNVPLSTCQGHNKQYEGCSFALFLFLCGCFFLLFSQLHSVQATSRFMAS